MAPKVFDFSSVHADGGLAGMAAFIYGVLYVAISVLISNPIGVNALFFPLVGWAVVGYVLGRSFPGLFARGPAVAGLAVASALIALIVAVAA